MQSVLFSSPKLTSQGQCLASFYSISFITIIFDFFFKIFFIEYINVFWCWNWDMDSSCAIIPFSPAEIPQNYPFKSRIAIIGRRHAGPQEAIQFNIFRNISIKKRNLNGQLWIQSANKVKETEERTMEGLSVAIRPAITSHRLISVIALIESIAKRIIVTNIIERPG